MVGLLQPLVKALVPLHSRSPQRQALGDQWAAFKRTARARANPERCGHHPLAPQALHMLPPMAELVHPELALRGSLGTAASTKFGLTALRDLSEPAWRFYTNAPRLRTRAQTGRVRSSWPTAGGGNSGSPAALSAGACLHIASEHLFAHYGLMAHVGADRAQLARPRSGGDCRGCRGGGRGRGCGLCRKKNRNDGAECQRTPHALLHLSGFGVRNLRPLVLQLVTHAQSREQLPMPLSNPLAALTTASATGVVVPALREWWPPLLQSQEAFEAAMLSVARVVRRFNLAVRDHLPLPKPSLPRTSPC